MFAWGGQPVGAYLAAALVGTIGIAGTQRVGIVILIVTAGIAAFALRGLRREEPVELTHQRADRMEGEGMNAPSIADVPAPWRALVQEVPPASRWTEYRRIIPRVAGALGVRGGGPSAGADREPR